ncbi:DUF362 domain-containing protein [Halovenus marina]|uniref:DUF362 domain-containing protein n=1 Tax=Halovenus marina TaxID=3396621 RepID=UPI003F562A86
MEISFPGTERFEGALDFELENLPRFATATRSRDQPVVEDVTAATETALEEIAALHGLPAGSRVALTAGSRGIHDMPEVLATTVTVLQNQGLEPFIMPAMGSHGGATAEGQVETLASLGVTPESMGCEIESSMAVTEVGRDPDGRPIYAADDALEADAVVLLNRVKAHTDYEGTYESGLAKMAVVGLGKHRGAEQMHNAALDRGFQEVIPERARVLIDETPVVGGIALIENANERAAEIVGLASGEIMDREPELLSRSKELLPMLPVDDLDVLFVEEMGKNVSGTGLDTNVLGRQLFHGQPEPDGPDITRIYVRSLTPESHGNALGMGLADFVHRDLVERVDFGDTYVNIATSGEPVRAKLPFVVPADETLLKLAGSTTGVREPDELRIAAIQNTLEPDDLYVSAPVAEELRDRPAVSVGSLESPTFDEDGTLELPFEG